MQETIFSTSLNHSQSEFQSTIYSVLCILSEYFSNTSWSVKKTNLRYFATVSLSAETDTIGFLSASLADRLTASVKKIYSKAFACLSGKKKLMSKQIFANQIALGVEMFERILKTLKYLRSRMQFWEFFTRIEFLRDFVCTHAELQNLCSVH